jgi:hypothetical protein
VAWTAYAAALGAPESALDEVVVRQPDYLRPSDDALARRSWRRTSTSTDAPCRAPRRCGAVEARRRARRPAARRGRRRAVRRAALPARGQGADGRARRQPRRGLPPSRSPSWPWMTPATGSRRWPSWSRSPRRSATRTAVARLLGARGDRRPARQRARGQRVRDRPRAGQARRPGRPRRVVHDAADRQRLLQPGDERDRLPGRHPAAAVLRRRGRRRGQLRRHRRGHRPRDRARLRRPGQPSTTATATSSTGGPTRTAPSSSARGRSSRSTTQLTPRR